MDKKVFFKFGAIQAHLFIQWFFTQNGQLYYYVCLVTIKRVSIEQWEWKGFLNAGQSPLNVNFSLFFVLFLLFPLMTEKDRKTCLNAKIDYFDQWTVCKAPIHWSKYTTVEVNLKEYSKEVITSFFDVIRLQLKTN